MSSLTHVKSIRFNHQLAIVYPYKYNDVVSRVRDLDNAYCMKVKYQINGSSYNITEKGKWTGECIL